MRTLRAAIALPVIVTLSCGASQRAGSAIPRGADYRIYQPLAIRDDAKAPHQAVLLGIDDRDGSAVVPVPVVATRAVIDALLVAHAPTGEAGGTRTIELATEPNLGGALPTARFEGPLGGPSHAAAWRAAVVAAAALGKDVTDVAFSARATGTRAPAASSGLLAGGFLATMTGVAVDPSATVTGIANPDGTLAPAAGLPEQFAAAIARGKRKLGYPSGARWARSATGASVDLVALAEQHGVAAIEVATVQQAYRLLTGKQLPEPVPVAEAEMAVDAATLAALEARYADWQQRLAGEWAALLQLQTAGRLPARLEALRQRAEAAAAAAEKLRARGQLARAYVRMRSAWVYAAAATRTHAILARVRAGDVEGALGALGSVDEAEQRTTDVLAQLGASPPATIGDHLRVLAALQAALRGWSCTAFARDALEQARAGLADLGQRPTAELGGPEIAELVVDHVAPALLLVAHGTASATSAAEELATPSHAGGRYTSVEAGLERIAASLQEAAATAVAELEPVLVDPVVAQGAQTVQRARARVAAGEPSYAVAYLLSRRPRDDGSPPGPERAGAAPSAAALRALAGSTLAYQAAAELVARYHALGMRLEPQTGEVAASAPQDRALRALLANADRRARAHARAARIATGAIPVHARLAYQQARGARGGDLGERLDALALFWMSSAYSQTAVVLARN